MSFRELEYFAAIAKTRNLTRAAESLFVSQPTLSKYLQNIENRIGVKLFERIGNQFLLTYAGKRYLSYVQQILMLEKDMQEEMNEISSQERGRLAIGCQMTRSFSTIPLTIPVFRKQYPHVDISLQERPRLQLEQMLLDGELDLVLFNFTENNPMLSYEVLDHEELLLITPCQHPLARFAETDDSSSVRRSIDLRLFAEETFILQHEDQSIGRIAREVLADAGISPHIGLETGSIEATLRLVESGLGCGFLIGAHLLKMTRVPSRVDSYSLKGQRRTIDLVVETRKNNYLSKHAEAYIQILRDIIHT